MNRDALCEQLFVGGVAGKRRCFEIRRVADEDESLEHGRELGVVPSEIFQEGRDLCKEMGSCFESYVERQIGILIRYFSVLKDVAGEAGASMGLSGGFDSRLLLLLSIQAGISIHPYTYASKDHSKEARLARAVAESCGLKLRLIPVRKWTDLSGTDLERNIDDAIAYYDGRTNQTMGTFNDVHTARIQRECLGTASVNLNGLGGELYRNRERLPPYPFKFNTWIWQYVAGPDIANAFRGTNARIHFQDRLAARYGRLLGIGKLAWIDRHLARRWYRDIWLPWFAGPRLEAENRVGPSFMPFADVEVSAEALAATRFIGAHGDFEAAMIRTLDDRIAALPSSYGPGFGPTQRHRKLRDFAMSLVPIWARLARNRARSRILSRSEAGIPVRYQERFAGPLGFLRSLDLPIDVDYLLRDSVSRDRTLYIAEYLYRHRDNMQIERTTGLYGCTGV